MTDVVLRRTLDGGFEHLSVGLSDEGDGSDSSEGRRSVATIKGCGEVRTGNSPSLPSSSSGSTDSMDVSGELSGHVVVDDSLDSLDIETTRREIGGEKVLDLSVLEILQSLQTLRRVEKDEEGQTRRTLSSGSAELTCS